MKVIIDIRVLEKWAQREYGSSLGRPMPSVTPTGDMKVDEDAQRKFPPFTRQIKLAADDPRLQDLRERLLQGEKSWPGIRGAVLVEREYDPQELAAAELFHLFFTELFDLESCGEDMGTEYDDSGACPKCGAGRTQRSPLRLDLSLAPKEADLAVTIACSEWIVSQRLADLMEMHRLSGYRLEKVEHRGRLPPRQPWYQLVVTGSAGHTVTPTRFGINYFTDDPKGLYTCPEHSLSGLHVLSEVFVSRQGLEEVDVALTTNKTGMRSGVVMPTPMLLISPRFYEMLNANRIRGYRIEIAHIVNS